MMRALAPGRSSLVVLSIGIVVACGTTACGTTAPSRELVNARTAFTRARSSAASDVVPADLHNAEQALRAAERGFEEDGNDQSSRDLAYVAERKALLAISRARAATAVSDEAEARRQMERAQDRLNQRTRQELSATRTQLQQRQQELAVRQEQVVQGQRELEGERRARLEAERRAEAALESLRQVASVREEQRGLVITLSGSVLFASGESSLLPIAQDRLNQVAQTLIDNGGTNIVVEGHTDSRGSRRQNADLSLARAESVRSYLVSKGVATASIRAVGIGPDRPVADNSTAEGRANNRRVEIIVAPHAAAPSR